MTNLFNRQLNQDMPVAVSGKGVYLFDSNGNRYLDACGGAAVSTLGYSNAKIRKSIIKQTKKLSYVHSGYFNTNVSEELAKTLSDNLPDGLDWVYIVSGGSEAVEASLKLARQYHLANGNLSKIEIISRHQSYHGSTLGALAAGENIPRRKPYEPLLTQHIHHIAPCHYWRWSQDNETEIEYGIRTANELENKILELGEDNVSAFICETIVGATMGAVCPVDGYFERIREICDKYNVLLILDEVMCGMGRCGKLFAFEYYNVEPDIVCIAKGLGAGYQPIGAMICNNSIYSLIRENIGFFEHGHSYLAHPTSCAAALGVLDELLNRNLLEKVILKGEKMKKMLNKKFSNIEYIGEIRGRGLLIGIELVKNKYTKEPFDPIHKIYNKVKFNALEEGLMVYPNGGSIDGLKGDHILIAPPFIINNRNIKEIVDKIALVLDKTIKPEYF
tara:strand:- start:2688 stop:4025 length:1338 start_codon:yes stop_codon:yes gene_type:complete